MNKILARCIFIAATATYLSFSICAPWVLSDNNTFLREFVNHELLNLLGVIVAITLASAANLHLEFNKIEEHAGREILPRTRGAVKKSASWLIGLFGIAFLLVLAKPLIVSGEVSASLINGLAVLIVLFNILILIDLTRLVFRIKPWFQMEQKPDDQNDEHP